jgi:hypothetical protein
VLKDTGVGMDAALVLAVLADGLPARAGAVRVDWVVGSVRSVGGMVGAELRVCDETSGEDQARWVGLVPVETPRDRAEVYLRCWLDALSGIVASSTGNGEPPVPDALVFCEALATDATDHNGFTRVFGDQALLAGWRAARADAEFREVVADLGLAEYTDALARLRRTSIRLCPTSGPAGRSQLGGLPDLPAGVAWPAGDRGPLPLLAQLDLASTRAADTGGLLPPAGLLQVYAEPPGHRPWPPASQPDVRILLHPPGTLLHPATPPPGLPLLPCRPVLMRAEDSVPPAESPYYRHLVGDDRALNVFADFLNEFHPPLADDHAEHRLLGYPDPLQDDPWVACATAQPSTPAHRWQLLLQVDSDNDPDNLLGDRGMGYVMVPEHRLRAGDLTTAHIVWHTH